MQPGVHLDTDPQLQEKALPSLAVFVRLKREYRGRDKAKTGYSETWSRNLYHFDGEAPGVHSKKHR